MCLIFIQGERLGAGESDIGHLDSARRGSVRVKGEEFDKNAGVNLFPLLQTSPFDPQSF